MTNLRASFLLPSEWCFDFGRRVICLAMLFLLTLFSLLHAQTIEVRLNGTSLTNGSTYDFGTVDISCKDVQFALLRYSIPTELIKDIADLRRRSADIDPCVKYMARRSINLQFFC
jgi:hypothetical protein